MFKWIILVIAGFCFQTAKANDLFIDDVPNACERTATDLVQAKVIAKYPGVKGCMNLDGPQTSFPKMPNANFKIVSGVIMCSSGQYPYAVQLTKDGCEVLDFQIDNL